MPPINILYEDDDVLAIHKPTGLAVHEDGHTNGPFLTDWVRSERPDMVGVGESMLLQKGEEIERPGMVHRLDRDTSGVLLLAKNQASFLFLKEQFQDRKIEKLYYAVVYGEIKDATGTVDKPIGRSKKDFRLWTADPPAKTKVREAVTRYTVMAHGNGFSLLAVEPKTGRTHQIRVHMKAIGHPIVCDERYAAGKECALGFDRLALHAHSISFTHPNGTRMTIEAPLPDVFDSARAQMQG